MFFLTIFFINSVGLGIGLAMDAFSVCIANGLKEPSMSRKRHAKMALIYAFFQFIMPLTGWICVHTISIWFKAFQKFIPWIALILLGYIGTKMIIEGIRESKANSSIDNDCINTENVQKNIHEKLSFKTLLIQGIATSIDALSVGFTISSYNFIKAFLSSLIIAIVTYAICVFGVKLGKIFGKKVNSYANFLGGSILIIIGLEIFIKAFV